MLRFSTSSSSDASEFVLSKGSSSRGIGVGGLTDIEYVSSPIVEVESGIEGDSGGGDCTRTFFVIFFGTPMLPSSAASWSSVTCCEPSSIVAAGLSGGADVASGGPFLLNGLDDGKSAAIFENHELPASRFLSLYSGRDQVVMVRFVVVVIRRAREV